MPRPACSVNTLALQHWNGSRGGATGGALLPLDPHREGCWGAGGPHLVLAIVQPQAGPTAQRRGFHAVARRGPHPQNLLLLPPAQRGRRRLSAQQDPLRGRGCGYAQAERVSWATP